MLVLSRRLGERIVINKNIAVVVCAVRGDRVRIGIEAPADVPIVRDELLDGDRDGQPNTPGGGS